MGAAAQVVHGDPVGQQTGAPYTDMIVEHLDLYVGIIGVIPMTNGVGHRLPQGFQRVVPYLIALRLARDDEPNVDMLLQEPDGSLDLLNQRPFNKPVINNLGFRAEPIAMNRGLYQR